ncbi:MAG: hypothetical protein ACREQ5_40395, partial [Candidatus Dormibacteria bacterium]
MRGDSPLQPACGFDGGVILRAGWKSSGRGRQRAAAEEAAAAALGGADPVAQLVHLAIEPATAHLG